MQILLLVPSAAAVVSSDPAGWRDAIDPEATLRILLPGRAAVDDVLIESTAVIDPLGPWLTRIAEAGLGDELAAVPPSTWPAGLAPLALAAAPWPDEIVAFVTALDVSPALVRSTIEHARTTGLARAAEADGDATLVAAVSPAGRAALSAWARATSVPPTLSVPTPVEGAPPVAAPRHELRAGVVYDDILAGLAQGDPAAPSPFVDPEGFLRFAAEPEIGGYAPISRYFMAARRSRHDLLVAFPEVPGRDSGAFLEWARTRGSEEYGVPVTAFAPPASPAVPAVTYRQAGVNLVGLVNAELGVGEVARRVERALAAAHLPHATIPFGGTRSRQGSTFRREPERFDTNLVCLNAESLPAFTQEVGPGFYEGRHTIGVWFWETSQLPSMFHSCFTTLDELWAASEYVVEVLRAAAPPELPVRRMPLPIIEPDVAPGFDPVALGIPADRPYFLCSFDYLSVPERKNPHGVIDAFRTAFAPDEGPVLVVKSINGHLQPAAAAATARAAHGRPDILLVDRSLTAADNNALLARSDCYVSLHRSEGYGLNLADALALGVPLIATGATGNMEFCSPDDCHLVRATTALVGPGNFPYDATSTWMEPDLAHAAELMRSVATDPAGARATAARARTRVLHEHTIERTAMFLRDRVAIARADREAEDARLAAATPPPPEPGLRARTRARLRSLRPAPPR